MGQLTIDQFDPASVGAVNLGPVDSSPAINAATDKVQDAGNIRFWPDNTDVRTDAFAQEALALGADAPELVTELLDRNSSVSSWLNVNNLQSRLDAGMITQREFDASVAAIAGAYSDGSIGFHNMSDMLGLRDAAFFYEGGTGQWPTQFRDALASAASDPTLAPVIEQFRTAFAQDVLDGDIPHAIPLEAQPSAGHVALALEQLNLNGPTAIADVLASLDSDTLQATLTRASNAGLGNIYLDQAGHSNAGDVFELITDSITAAGNDELALEVVRFADGAGKRGFFEGIEAIPERAEILGELLVNHSDAILSELTLGSQNTELSGGTELGRNLGDLSNLLRLTAFNPDNPNQPAALDALTEFTASTISRYNELTEAGQLTGAEVRELDSLEQQLISLSAGVQDVYRSASSEHQELLEFRQAVAGFVIDTALTAVPIISRGKGAIAGEIASLFPAESIVGGAVERVLTDFSGDIINQSTGLLTREARDAIVEALGDNEEVIAELFAGAENFVMDSILELVNTPAATAREARQTLEQIDNSQ